MIPSEQELLQAIEEVGERPSNYSNCEKLATFHTLRHFLYGDTESIRKVESVIGEYGESEFLRLVAGQPTKDVMLVINELMDALKALNPKLYENTMRRL